MLVSFYILAYNHEDMIADAIDGALSQTYSPLEIIISDDCSTDNTWEIIKNKASSYSGPHTIILRRNEFNLGISNHINQVWNVCSGMWVVASAGDDVSLPNRVEKIVEVVKSDPDVKLIQSWLNEIDEDGCHIKINKLDHEIGEFNTNFYTLNDRISGNLYHPHGAAMAYSREVLDVFGPMPDNVIFEDNIINVRSELIGKAMLLPIPLVNHRNHRNQITYTGANVDIVSQNRRLKKRLDSDVSSSLQNILDLNIIRGKLTAKQFEKVNEFLIKRFNYFKARRNALLIIWPFRLWYLPKVILNKKIADLSRDDLMRSMFPDRMYRILKAMRIHK